MADLNQQASPPSAIKLALLARKVREEIEELKYLKAEPIAIIGMGCRFPGGVNSPSQYWDLLINKKDAICEIPKDRWDIDAFYDPAFDKPGKISTRWGGFLDQVDQFDPIFFGISPREARAMDPQQRLFLEVAYEALEDAGLTFKDLSNTHTGVFATSYHNDYAYLQHSALDQIDGHTITGISHAIVPNRLSFFLNLHGPSLSVDTACSSSLVAVHLACQGLRNEECDIALTGGVNLIISPDVMISLSKVGFLAPDGRCRTFDADASGFVRGEGCGVIILKRLSDALANGDQVLAIIRGSAVNQDGHSNVLTAPNGLAQQEVIRQALENARVSPNQISYIEAHGTGTPLGDPIEVEALAEVIGRRADNQAEPCVLASVKTNFGHLEAAAGIAGLMKIVLSMQHQAIPPHLHFKKLNPHISLDGTPFVIPTEIYPWLTNAKGRFAGVSSFGVGGTNAHIILEEAPRHSSNSDVENSSRTYLLPLSAHTPQALHATVQSFQDFLGGQSQDTLKDICYTASVRRNHHVHRLALIGNTPEQFIEKLNDIQQSRTLPSAVSSNPRPGNRQKLAFVFSGQGQQRWNMGRELLESEPVFRKVIEQSSTLFEKYASWSLLAELTAPEEKSRLNQTEIAQPAIFAIQVALAALWHSWGIIPNAVVGHSVGEIAAAHIAHAISLEDAVRIVFHRGRLMQKATGLGKMVAVEIPFNEVERLIADFHKSLSIAAINSPTSTVLSGEAETLETVIQSLQQKGIRTQMLPVNYAFHSPQMDPYQKALMDELQGFVPSRSTIPICSTVFGKTVKGTEFDAAYWARNIREPVNFTAAIESLIAEDYGVFVEVGAHPVLSGNIDQILKHQKRQGHVLASLRGKKPEQRTMLTSLGELYMLGFEIDWNKLYPSAGVVSLPTFSWQRKRYWIDAVQAGPKAGSLRTSGIHPLMGSRLRSPVVKEAIYESQLSATIPQFVADHRVFENVILPATAYLETALAAIHDVLHTHAFGLKDIVIQAAMHLPADDLRTVQTVLEKGDGNEGYFRIFSLPKDAEEWMLHASGKFLNEEQSTPKISEFHVDELQKRLAETISGEAHYRAFQERGIEFGLSFQGVKKIWRDMEKRQALGQIQLPDTLIQEINYYRFHPALLDACLQVLTAVLPSTSDTYLPISFDRLRIFSHPDIDMWSYVQLGHGKDLHNEILSADFYIFHKNGLPVLEIEGMHLKRATRETLSLVTRKQSGALGEPGFYEVGWNKMPLVAQTHSDPARNLLIFADQGGVGIKVAESLSALGHTCTLVYRGSSLQVVEKNIWKVGADTSAYISQLLTDALPGNHQVWHGVIYLWALDAAPDTAFQDQQKEICGGALHVVQALIQAHDRFQPRLWLITRGSQPVMKDAVAVAQAPVWGLCNTVALEHPELSCVRVDLDPAPEVDNTQNILDEILADTDEERVGFRAGIRYVARLLEIKIPSGTSSLTSVQKADVIQPTQLNIPASHTLDDLEVQSAIHHTPRPGEVEIRVEATGLNFRDVLRVLGMYPGEESPLGNECVGRIVSLGDDVKDFAIGDQVMAIATGSFGTFVTTPTDLIIRKPDHLSVEQAATVPIAFLTAHYALNHLAKIKAGDKVLIHAAAGGVGLAAVQLAKRAGAEIFCTAGNPEKRAHLKSLGVQHILDSRSLGFADEIMEITQGKGVDIILNSLTGDFIAKSVSVLNEHGCFLEIGKTGVWDQSQFTKARPGASYHVIFLGEIFNNDPHLTQIMLRELISEFESGNLSPLPHKIFSMAGVKEAFRYMARAMHIGKIVITHPQTIQPDRRIQPDATYLITGGAGGLGLATAGWLVEQGANHIVLFSRSARSQQQTDEWKKASGAEILIMQGDVSCREDVEKLLQEIRQNMPPLRGIFHAAGIVVDGVVAHQDWDRFTQVMNAKISGTWHLHELTQAMELDFFVMFSSVASIFGSAGQANYAAGNSFLDALAHYRRSKGLPALSVNWGSWKNLGMTSRLDSRDQLRFENQGINGITSEQGVRALQRLLENPSMTQVAVLSIRWETYFRSIASPFFSEIAGQHKIQRTIEIKQEPGFLQEFNRLLPARKLQMLRTFLQEQARRVLGLDTTESIDLNQPLRELGLDSLIAVELRNLLGSSLKAELPATLLFDYPTINVLSNYLFSEVLQQKNGKESDAISESMKRTTSRATDLHVEGLSEAEAEALLLAELDNKEIKGAKK
jgi:acyl transferase domain-containing protein/NADPH:quinone reductase-like Zn-dependent oxidoreductase/acyl carrier protein